MQKTKVSTNYYETHTNTSNPREPRKAAEYNRTEYENILHTNYGSIEKKRPYVTTTEQSYNIPTRPYKFTETPKNTCCVML